MCDCGMSVMKLRNAHQRKREVARRATNEARAVGIRSEMLCDRDVAQQAHRDVLVAVSEGMSAGLAGGQAPF